MKQNLLLLVLSFIFTQQIQSQVTTGDLISVGTSLFGSSKKQKKIDREKFVRDSINNATTATTEKRRVFVRDSTLNAEVVSRKNREIETEKSRHIWFYVSEQDNNTYAFTFNKTIVGLLDKGSDTYADIVVYSDSTKRTTTKIDSIKLSQIVPTQIFDVLAYNSVDDLELFKSRKDNKLYVLPQNIFYHTERSSSAVTKLTTEYTDPQIAIQEKMLLSNYRLKLNNAISTVTKLEAINNKHLVNMVNAFGVVVEQKFDVSKFTAQEKVTYKQLVIKLEKQNNELSVDRDKKIGKKTLENMTETPDWNKRSRIEHALSDYAYYALNW